MTCQEATSFISDYLAGELDAETRAAFDYHLSLCPNCVQYVADFERTIQLGQGAYPAAEDPGADVPEDVVAAILKARQGLA